MEFSRFMNRPLQRWLLCAVLASMPWCFRTAGQSFSAEGTLGCRSSSSVRAGEEDTYTFTIHVQSPRWQLRMEPLSAARTNPHPIHYITGFDGETYFVVSSREVSGVQDVDLLKGPANAPIAYAGTDLMQSIAPLPGAVFIAFSFVPEVRKTMVVGHQGLCIWGDPVLNKHHVRFDVSTEIFFGGGLPQEKVAWQNDGRFAYEGDNGELLEKFWPRPYDRAYTNALYVASVTNVADIALPAAASLSVFAPDLVSRSGDIILQELFELRVSRILPACQIAEFKPELAAGTTLIDKRWMTRDMRFHPTKVAANGTWDLVSMNQLAEDHAAFLSRGQPGLSGNPQARHQSRILIQMATLTGLMGTILAGLACQRFRARRTSRESVSAREALFSESERQL